MLRAPGPGLGSLLLLVTALASMAALSCSSTAAPSASGADEQAGAAGEQGEGGSAGEQGGDAGGAADSAGAGGGSGGGVGIAGSGSGTPVEAEVYAHSSTRLYRLDPVTKKVADVGVFDCTQIMWDIALDKDNVMFGTTSTALVSIDRATAKCKTIKSSAQYPNSLTFVPAGVLDANDEVLVGYKQSVYVRIDKATGQQTDIGNLNPNPTGKDWVSSGDIVSIIGDRSYLTVKPTFGGGGADTLIEVDPKTGKAVKVLGQVLLSDVWGLAYWGGLVYGFSDGGELVELDLVSGKASLVQGLPGGLSFWGAGVTTSAPIAPVK
jgi:hypothetical protein